MKPFTIGTVDKSGRFIKTAEGWKPLKKGDRVEIPTQKVAHSAPVAVTPRVGKAPSYSSIYEAQVAWLKKEITHKEYLQEQAALYAHGVISKQHTTVKLK